MSVPDRVQLTVPETLDIEITAGASAADLGQRFEEAEKILESASAAAGVSSPEEAREAFEERREALRLIKTRDQAEQENLRDLTYEQIERKVIGLGKSIPVYPDTRVSTPPLCSDLESSMKELRKAEKSLDEARQDWEAARDARNAVREVRDKLRESSRETRIQLNLKEDDLRHAEEELSRARARISDEELRTNLEKATGEVRLQEGNFRDAESALKKKAPEKVKTLMETTMASLQTIQKKRKNAQTELTEVRTRLKVLGGGDS